MKYQIFNNGKPADSKHFSLNNSIWEKSIFNTFKEALDYAENWFGDFFPDKNSINVDTIFNYGYGDTGEIRKIHQW